MSRSIDNNSSGPSLFGDHSRTNGRNGEAAEARNSQPVKGTNGVSQTQRPGRRDSTRPRKADERLALNEATLFDQAPDPTIVSESSPIAPVVTQNGFASLEAVTDVGLLQRAIGHQEHDVALPISMSPSYRSRLLSQINNRVNMSRATLGNALYRVDPAMVSSLQQLYPQSGMQCTAFPPMRNLASFRSDVTARSTSKRYDLSNKGCCRFTDLANFQALLLEHGTAAVAPQIVTDLVSSSQGRGPIYKQEMYSRTIEASDRTTLVALARQMLTPDLFDTTVADIASAVGRPGAREKAINRMHLSLATAEIDVPRHPKEEITVELIQKALQDPDSVLSSGGRVLIVCNEPETARYLAYRLGHIFFQDPGATKLITQSSGHRLNEVPTLKDLDETQNPFHNPEKQLQIVIADADGMKRLGATDPKGIRSAMTILYSLDSNQLASHEARLAADLPFTCIDELPEITTRQLVHFTHQGNQPQDPVQARRLTELRKKITITPHIDDLPREQGVFGFPELPQQRRYMI